MKKITILFISLIVIFAGSSIVVDGEEPDEDDYNTASHRQGPFDQTITYLPLIIIIIVIGIIILVCFKISGFITKKSYCPECGKLIKNDLKFCPNCGKSFK